MATFATIVARAATSALMSEPSELGVTYKLFGSNPRRDWRQRAAIVVN
jgi:hypothetical protein